MTTYFLSLSMPFPVCCCASMPRMRFRSSFFLLGGFLLLSACGGDDRAGIVDCANAYWDGEVGLCISQEWRVVDRAELDERGVSEEAIIAFQSERPYAGQFATVVVTREVLAQTMTTPEYSAASILSVSGLPDYEEIDRRAIRVDGQESAIHVFAARPRADALTERFYQISAVTGNTGYTVTAATPLTVEAGLNTQVTTMLRSLTFTPPDGEGTASD